MFLNVENLFKRRINFSIIDNYFIYIILFLILNVSSAHAGRFTAFGPQDFLRDKGKPITESSSFNIKNPDTSYSINLYNGGFDSQYSEVSSAIIRFNNKTLFTTSDFNKKAGFLTKEINVANENELQVELRSNPGSGQTIVIEGEDNTTPDVSISNPEDNFYTNIPSIAISGSASDSISWIDGVSINGYAAEITGESFTLSSLDLLEGTNTVTVEAADAAGNTSGTSVNVILDTIAPIITLDHIITLTNNPIMQISGNVEDTSPIDILNINGISVSLTNNSFSTNINLTEGSNNIEVTATDKAGNMAESTVEVVLDTTPPVISVTSPTEGASVTTDTIEVIGTIDDDTAAVTVNGEMTFVANGTFEVQGINLNEGLNIITIISEDLAGNVSTVSLSVYYPISEEPFIPAIDAPPLDNTVATSISSATEFLYSGDNPVQVGLSANTIEAKHVAVLRGKAFDNEGLALSGIKITILDHSEYGYTYTREDGMFDMVVNGGGWITVNYEKEGYLLVQRKIDAPWRDYAWVDDVIMSPFDTQVTNIDLANSTEIQVARGSEVWDEDGTRQATMFFTPETSAEMVLPDGTTQSLTDISVRATEYTVGENGPKRMPGLLPSTSGYTYAVELSVDEAISVGAATVNFSQPVYVYVENFLDFPVGGIVPSGYYDREKGVWMPSANGRIIKVLSINNNMADIDMDGSGNPADLVALASLGITDNERQQLASIYQSGQSLWRVPVTHFTPWDFNWPYGLPEDAEPPGLPNPDNDNLLDDPSCQGGSIIECENQVLGEKIKISGTPFSLNYKSDRVSGRKAAYTLKIPVSGDSIPSSLKRIRLEIEIAGNRFIESLAASSNQSYTFVWDGKDTYGRILNGPQTVTVRLGYVYDLLYYEANDDWRQSFAATSNVPMTYNRSRGEITLWQESQSYMGLLDSRMLGFGGWSLDINHAYEMDAKTLHMGNGTKRSAENMMYVIDTVAGWYGHGGLHGEGPATGVILSYTNGVTLDSKGNLYIASKYGIWKVDSEGIIRKVAKGGGYSGDGGPAIDASVNNPYGMTFDDKGNLYIADRNNHRIRKIDTEGIITTVAGNGNYGFGGDGGPATEAKLHRPTGVDVDSAGNLYIASFYSNRLHKVSPDGIITTLMGDGFYERDYYKYPVTPEEDKCFPFDVAVANEGDLYVSCYYGHVIRKIRPDGSITTVAGNGNYSFSGDGGPATGAELGSPAGIALDSGGNLYIMDRRNNRIRKVSSDGIITTVAGNGSNLYRGDGEPANSTGLWGAMDVTTDREGNFYIAGFYSQRIYKVSKVMPGFTGNDIAIPSKDGSEIYGFDARGRHLKTVDSMMGTTVYSFTYDSLGHLKSVTDRNGNITTIERDAEGQATAIVAPGGQRTTLILNYNGYIESIINPAGEQISLNYTEEGLLISMSHPAGNTYTFTYDAEGRLIKDEDPAGGFKELWRSDFNGGYSVHLSTALGKTTSYLVEEINTGGMRRVITGPSGLSTEIVKESDGSIMTTSPDGTISYSLQGPDPRFKMQSPVNEERIVTTPSGLLYGVSEERTVTLSDPDNMLSILTKTDTFTVNGNTYTDLYEADIKTATFTTPEGRKKTKVLDSLGRIVSEETEGIALTSYSYDSMGRLSAAITGSGASARSYSINYNTKNEIISISDPLSRSVSFEYDLAGRMSKQSLPDGRATSYTYDANGNVTSITPPGRSPHVFNYTPVDLAANYGPPVLGNMSSTAIIYSYNLDKDLVSITRPDGKTINYGYDRGGRLKNATLPRGSVVYSYSEATGNLEAMMDPDGGMLLYTYDGFLPLSETWNGEVSGSVSRAYNNDFRVTSQTVNGSNTVNYGYDNDGLLTQAGLLSIGHEVQNDLLTDSTLGGVTDSYEYNEFGEAISYSASYGDTMKYNVAYERDKLGRIVTMTQIIDGETSTSGYSYDVAGRLTDITFNGNPTTHYNYDSNGNRLSDSGPYGIIEGTYDAQDRMLSYERYNYTYTKNGELKTKTDSTTGDVTTYNYDVLGNLLSVNLPDGTNIEYVIDGRNRRVGKKVNGTLVQGFLYGDQLNPVAELDGNGNIVSRFVYGIKSNVPDYMIKNGITYRIISNHLGSPNLIINASTGNIAQQIKYDEFGNIGLDTNSGFQPFGYAGGIYDQHTKLTRFGARDYDAFTGRWKVKDPIGFNGGDTNLYGYVQQNPVNWIDPWGEAETDPWSAALGPEDEYDAEKVYDPVEMIKDPYFYNGVNTAIEIGNMLINGDPPTFIERWFGGDGFKNFSNKFPLHPNDLVIDPEPKPEPKPDC